jgi:hypothetical protein
MAVNIYEFFSVSCTVTFKTYYRILAKLHIHCVRIKQFSYVYYNFSYVKHYQNYFCIPLIRQRNTREFEPQGKETKIIFLQLPSYHVH